MPILGIDFPLEFPLGMGPGWGQKSPVWQLTLKDARGQTFSNTYETTGTKWLLRQRLDNPITMEIRLISHPTWIAPNGTEYPLIPGFWYFPLFFWESDSSLGYDGGAMGDYMPSPYTLRDTGPPFEIVFEKYLLEGEEVFVSKPMTFEKGVYRVGFNYECWGGKAIVNGKYETVGTYFEPLGGVFIFVETEPNVSFIPGGLSIYQVLTIVLAVALVVVVVKYWKDRK